MQILLSIVLSLCALPLPAEDLPLEPTRTITFTTDEGTNVALDVSPDGRSIVFNLLGDLYELPIAGGKARPLTRGIANDGMPRYSPDGQWIAYVSDRSGRNQIWIIRADGTQARQITRETEKDLEALIWTPDGGSIIASRGDGRGGYAQLWSYDLGTGAGVCLFKDDAKVSEWPLDVPGLTGSSLHPDRKRLWYSKSKQTAFADARGTRESTLHMLDLSTGTSAPVATPDDNGARPLVSPDGRWLAYVAEQRDPARTLLRLRSIDGGEKSADRILATVDLQHRHVTVHGYAFTPDGRALVVMSGGKFVRIATDDGSMTHIPFTADVRAELGPLVMVQSRIDDGPLPVQRLSGMTYSPDGQHTAFSAVGKVWRVAAGQRPMRLTREQDTLEYEPAFSPDGRWIVLASWSEHTGGRLWKVPAQGGTPTALTPESPAYYSRPQWTPDGTRLVFIAVPDYRESDEGKLRAMTANGGAVQELATLTASLGFDSRNFSRPTVSADGKRVFYVDDVTIHSVSLTGGEPHAELALKVLEQPYSDGSQRTVRGTISPDGKWLAVQYFREIVLAPMPRRSCGDATACILDLDKDPTVIKVTRGGGIEPSWSADGQWLSWGLGNHVFRARTADLVQRPASSPSQPESMTVDLRVPRQGGRGVLLLRGARLVTMASRGNIRTPTADGGVHVKTDPLVIERGDLLIRDRRIAAIGPSGSLAGPRDATVLDMAGKTIIPGLLDLHSDGFGRGNLLAHGAPWDFAARLAYGITTARNTGYPFFDTRELLESGALTGPRQFSHLGMPSILSYTSLEGARQILRADKANGADFIKVLPTTTRGSRLQQQWLTMAAAAERINVTGHWIGEVVHDGRAGFEHQNEYGYYYMKSYHDATELLARSGTTWTPTLTASRVPPESDEGSLYSLFERCLDFTSPKLRRFLPPELRLKNKWGKVRRPCDPDFGIGLVANAVRAVRDVLRAGGNVAASAHGNSLDGVFMTQWEMDVMVRGGMTPAEALRTATLNGARALGVERDLGSLEVGKLADLVVLEANPLEDIRHVLDVRYVMKNGELYDGETLDSLWPAARKFPPPPWQR